MNISKDLKDSNNSSHKQKIFEYGFTVMSGLSRRTKRRLLKNFSEEEILSFSDKELQMNLTSQEWIHYCKQKNQYNDKNQSNNKTQYNDKNPCNYKNQFNIEETEKQWLDLGKKNIDFVYHKDDSYPEKLRQIEDYPLGLFKKGSLPGQEKAIGIVGSRIPSAYGKEMASYFARELSKAGVTIISGMAYGIDVASHNGALDAGGLTFGVLGCGPDIVYPKENFAVYERMIRQGGILSEYMPGTIPASFRFPERNRIISGLSDGVLVVEAKAKSGSLITADQALEQGKDVFALPGRAGDPLSEGCNWLIREGARMVTEPSHILEELFHLCEQKVKNSLPSEKLLDNKEKVVYDCLSLDPKNIEEIINITNFTVSEVISILFRLELNGYVSQIVKDYYIRRMI